MARMKRRRKADLLPSEEEAASLVCPECGDVHHGPHTGEHFFPYGPSEQKPDYRFSQGLCNKRTCIRVSARKHEEFYRSLAQKRSPQPDSFYRKRAREHEAETEAAVRRGNPQWGIPPSEVVEDWGQREPNPDMSSGGVAFEPLQPPIDWEGDE